MTPDPLEYLKDVLRVTKLKRLGRGGFAVVYSGEKDKVQHAFKISHDPLDEKLKNMANQELDFLGLEAILGCDQIVKLHGWDDKTGHLITWWELGKQSLGDRLKAYAVEGRAGLPPDELRPYLFDAATGIDVVNELRIWHRDIKPDNLLLFPNGRVKVADFGLARFTGASTMSMTAAGTMGYIALEGYGKNDGQRGKPKPTVDIYALAATAIKLATGNDPFGESPPEILEAQRTGRAVTRGLTPSQTAAVLAALDPDPAQRPFKTASEFVNAFLNESVVAGTSRLSSPKGWMTGLATAARRLVGGLPKLSSPTAPIKQPKSTVESKIQTQPATVKAVRQKAVGTRAIIIDLCRVGCVATIDDIPLLREYGRTLMETNPDRFCADRASQHSEEGKLVTLVLLAANVTSKNLTELIAAAKAKEGRSTSDYAQSYRTAEQIEAQRAQFAPAPSTPPKRTRTEHARLIVIELRQSLDRPKYDAKEIQRRYESAKSLCTGKCLEYLQRSENWFHEGELGGAKRALTNALRKYLGGD